MLLSGSGGWGPCPPGRGSSRSSASRSCSGPGSRAGCSPRSSWSTSSSTPSWRRASRTVSRSRSAASPRRGYGAVYPALIAPAYAAFERVPDAYAVIKTINSLVMSLAAIPAYFIARRVVGQRLALAAAVLAVAVPSMVYTAVVMTENAFYPVFLLAALALVALLERPSTRRYVAFFAALGLAFLTRSQAVVIAAAAVTAPILIALWTPGAIAGDASLLRLAVCDLRRRRRRRRRSPDGARAAAQRAARRLRRRRRVELRRRAGAAFHRLPRRRARPLPRRDPVRGRDRAHRQGALARPPAPGAARGHPLPASSGAPSSSGRSRRGSPTASRSATCSSSRRCS